MEVGCAIFNLIHLESLYVYTGHPAFSVYQPLIASFLRAHLFKLVFVIIFRISNFANTKLCNGERKIPSEGEKKPGTIG
jgi:hypothetical protein